MIDLDIIPVRELQKECARAMAHYKPSNNDLTKFSKQAHHNSVKFYQAVVNHYVYEFGDLPSRVGPGVDIKLVCDD